MFNKTVYSPQAPRLLRIIFPLEVLCLGRKGGIGVWKVEKTEGAKFSTCTLSSFRDLYS